MQSSESRELIKVFKALANHRRIETLLHLKKYRALNVSGVAEKLDLSMRSTSKHLLKLEEAGLIKRTPRSRDVYYSLADGYVKNVIGMFARMSE